MKKFYITTPIYYPSAKLHIGHAYTTIAGDVLKRYKKLEGYDVFYLTGTDEHGQKIETVAKQNNKTAQLYVDEIVKDIKEVWSSLNIEYDKFIRTTDTDHKEVVQKIFDQLLEQDDIYLSEYEGLYCRSDEAYYTETQSKDGYCPDCGKKLEIIKEESYFFRCSKYVDRLLELFDENPDFLLPQFRVKELVNNFIKDGLEDLAVSRTSFKWGIPVKNNENHVIYVWVDALSNYITALGYLKEDDSNFKKYWPADVQLLGKEITRFHAIYWPMILMALNLPMPKKLFSHGWLLMENDKMSKSKGNVIYPDFLIENYGSDVVRYYLMREVPFGSDGQFTPTSFINRINNDVVNDLSNLVNRTATMGNKYFQGTINNNDFSNQNYTQHNELIVNSKKEYDEFMNKLEFSKALESLWKLISATNKLIDLEEPWVLAKDKENEKQLEKCMWQLIESIKNINKMLYPFMPIFSEKVNAIFNFNEYKTMDKYIIIEKPEIIYQRLDADMEINKIRNKMLQDMEASKKKIADNENVPRGTIKFKDFEKVNLEVAKILEVKKHPQADKLLVFKLELKNKKIQIVSGLANHYNNLEELLSKNILIVENLEPIKIRGIESEGMILTTENGEEVKIIEINAPVGSLIS